MSEVITDKLTGRATAGDVTITDGSVTMKLQDGVIKSWCLWEQDSTQAVTDSLNVSSIADNGTGYTTQTFTNNFNNANICPTYNGVHDAGTYVAWGVTAHDTPPTTSTIRAEYLNNAGATTDVEFAASHIVGDLA